MRTISVFLFYFSCFLLPCYSLDDTEICLNEPSFTPKPFLYKFTNNEKNKHPNFNNYIIKFKSYKKQSLHIKYLHCILYNNTNILNENDYIINKRNNIATNEYPTDFVTISIHKLKIKEIQVSFFLF